MLNGPNARTKEKLRENLKVFSNSKLLSPGFFKSAVDNVHTRNFLSFGPAFATSRESKVAIDHALIVLFANRSGSNFLSHLVGSTGHYNVAGEVFNVGNVKKFCEKRNFATFAEYIDFLKKRDSQGKRFAFKVSLTQYLLLYAGSFLDSHFPNRTVVVVDRSDKFAQAISFWIANHTKQWMSTQEASWKGEVPFDGQKITRLVSKAFADERDTRIALSLLGQPFLMARYEEFAAEPLHTVTRICRESGITAPVELDPAAVKIEKQASAVNEMLMDKLMAHLRSTD